jgi:hypothetical protein
MTTIRDRKLESKLDFFMNSLHNNLFFNNFFLLVIFIRNYKYFFVIYPYMKFCDVRNNFYLYIFLCVQNAINSLPESSFLIVNLAEKYQVTKM